MESAVHNTRIQNYIVIISLTILIPSIVTILYLLNSGISKDIAFAQWELFGSQYQRPLEKLMENLQFCFRTRSTKAEAARLLQDAINQMEIINTLHGSALQFTKDELVKRKREAIYFPTFKENLQKFIDHMEQNPTTEERMQEYLDRMADLRMAITHAGDTSNLILDPDLDTYYLMDITLVALPQNQDRIAAVANFLDSLKKATSLTLEQRIRLAIFAAQLKEADLDRISADHQTVINEDGNFYGTSDSLQKRLPEGFSAYTRETQLFIDLISKLKDSETLSGNLDEALKAGETARLASYQFWNLAVGELDTLLKIRISHLSDSRQNSLFGFGCGLIIAILAIWFLTAKMLNRVQAAMLPLHEVIGKIGPTIENLLSYSHALADGATKQAASIQQTSASLEELNSMLSLSAQNSQKTFAITNESANTINEGMTDLSQLSLAITEIKSSSGGISEIIKVIESIAFQTNLLALNAAVEAARAGQAGLGFTVVAEEVRNLARKSAESSQESEIKIALSLEKTDFGVEINQLVVKKFDLIHKQILQINELVRDISSASTEQSKGLEQINQAINEIQVVIQDTAEKANSISEVVTNLTEQGMWLEKSYQSLNSLL